MNVVYSYENVEVFVCMYMMFARKILGHGQSYLLFNPSRVLKLLFCKR